MKKTVSISLAVIVLLGGLFFMGNHLFASSGASDYDVCIGQCMYWAWYIEGGHPDAVLANQLNCFEMNCFPLAI